MEKMTDGILSPYRILDLTDKKGLICAKILGDLGADVIKIEKPGGDSARNMGPFYHDEINPEKSLFWFAFNNNKRGITLDIEAEEGKEILRKLVESADVVSESFSPGYLDELDLGYSALKEINPNIILVSITPFGQTGPYRDYKSCDIVAWAMSGEMETWGDADRPPVRISHHPQTYLHAGADGALGAVMAIYQRESFGGGQHIDISIRESISLVDGGNRNLGWVRAKQLRKRTDELRPGINHKTTQIWPCKDGYVSWSHGGPSPLGPSLPLIKWMESEGITSDLIKNFNWNKPGFLGISQEEMDQIEEPTARFFMTHTKAELLEGAIKHKVMLYPVATSADMLENIQLTSREFWMEVEHPELGTTITYPGAFGIFSEMSPRISRRAPLIGEHNEEIYEKELGISREKLITLKQAGVI